MKNHPLAISRGLSACALLSLSALAFADSSIKGVPNFHVINDQVLRGGQPSDAGFRNLAAMGVKTILDLTEDDDRSHAEKKFVKAQGMQYVSVPMKGMTTPTDKQISHALKVLNDSGAAPVFIHCKRGADRTGVVMACYRIEHDHWDNDKALREARNLGMSWFQFPLQRYVSSYEPRDNSILNPAGIAEAIKDETADLAKRVSQGITGVLDGVRK